jgi:nucleoside 2-deoxyribosyltransferase
MKALYLCGPITGNSYDEATDWRRYVASKLAPDVVPMSPMRGKGYLAGEDNIAKSYEKTAMSTKQAITARDRFDVMVNCDAILANFLDQPDVISIGSVLEFGWADAARKPIIFVAQKDNIHHHPIMDDVAGFVVETLDSGIEIANIMLSDEFARKNQ